MRLAIKLTAAFLLVVLLVMGFRETRRLQLEVLDFEQDLDRTHGLVGQALARAVALTARRDGLAAGRRILGAATGQNGGLQVRWVCIEGAPPPLIPCEVALHAEGSAQATVPRPGAPALRVTAVPLGAPDEGLGAIEVSESPSHEGRWTRRHFRESLLLGLLMVAATALSAFVLGWWMVARPTQALVDKARAVGRGEWGAPLPVSSRDEFGTLAAEMNAMCADLERARDEATRASQVRARVLERLRHADRLATVGKVASGMAHELGTPLNVIEARAGMLAEDAGLEEPQRQSARVIVGCTEQMAHVIRELLQYAGTRRLEKSLVDLGRLAASVEDLLRPLAQQRGVRLVHRVEGTVMVEADGMLVQQALTNLVVNALHASRDGQTVEVQVGSERRVPPEELGGEARFVFLRVVDRGVGIAPEHLPRLFEPFFTTKPSGQGTGLGLPVTQGIAEEHEGWLDMTSTLDQGSTFTLYLQAVEARA